MEALSHLLAHVLTRRVAYPVFYWVGFGVVKALSLGRAAVQDYAELGMEEDAAWWEFRIRRYGIKFWRTETLIMVGGVAVLVVVSGYYVIRYLW